MLRLHLLAEYRYTTLPMGSEPAGMAQVQAGGDDWDKGVLSTRQTVRLGKVPVGPGLWQRGSVRMRCTWP